MLDAPVRVYTPWHSAQQSHTGGRPSVSGSDAFFRQYVCCPSLLRTKMEKAAQGPRFQHRLATAICVVPSMGAHTMLWPAATSRPLVKAK